MKRESLKWEDLQYFYSLAKAGSLAAAAKRLGVNQSTVFRRLQTLESQTGERLFIRKRRGYELSSHGQALFNKVADVGLAMEGIEKDFRPGGRKRIKVTTFAAFAEDYLPAIIQQLETEFPQIEIDVLVGREASDLMERNVDIAFRSCAEPPLHLIGKSIAQKRWGFYVSKQYRQNYPGLIDIQKPSWFEPYQFLRYPNHQQLAAYQWFYQHIPEQYHRAGSNSLETLAAMCQAGAGVALLCEGIRTKGLSRLAYLPESTNSHFWLLYHPELRQNKTYVQIVSAFKEKITACF